MRGTGILASTLIGGLMAFASVALAATVVVTPANMDGWAEQETGTATTQMVNGPAPTPAGTGSAEFRVGADGASGAQLRNTLYAGTELTALTELKYWTYVSNNVDCQAVYIILSVDTNGDGIQDDSLFFEPCYQSGTYGTVDPSVTVPDQCADPNCVTLNTWQEWDALIGGWWSFNALTFGPPLTTIAFYASQHPGARIVNSVTGLGGVRLVAGFGAGAWDNFVGNTDAFTIGVSGTSTTYDFELRNVPTSQAQCKNGGWMTLTDDQGNGFKNQGDCVSYVATRGKNKGRG